MSPFCLYTLDYPSDAIQPVCIRKSYTALSKSNGLEFVGNTNGCFENSFCCHTDSFPLSMNAQVTSDLSGTIRLQHRLAVRDKVKK